jgi:hypothetical protein
MKLFKTLPCCPFLLAAYLLRRVPFLLRLCLLSCTSLPVRRDDLLAHPCTSPSHSQSQYVLDNSYECNPAFEGKPEDNDK